MFGATTYTTGQHDFRIRVDGTQEDSSIVIGMTSNPGPPLDTHTHSPGLGVWNGCGVGHFIPSGGCIQEDGDVGQDWNDGDILHLHLNCQRHVMNALARPTRCVSPQENCGFSFLCSRLATRCPLSKLDTFLRTVPCVCKIYLGIF